VSDSCRLFLICPTLFGFVDRKIGAKYCYSKIISFDILLRDPRRQTIPVSLC